MDNQKQLYSLIGIIATLLLGALIWWATIDENELAADTSPIDDADVQTADVRVDQPLAGATITSPLTVTGEARGSWFFEGVMPVRLALENGTVIAQTNAVSSEEWMTEEYIPFTATLIFNVNAPQAGELIVAKDNPSGLPENDAEVRIPITIVSGE